MLDRRFFERTATKPFQNDALLESYKAVYARSTMVLFSRQTATPLAALTLKTDDVGCLSLLTGRPSPGSAMEPYFQGMLSMSNQAFTFTITNLSDKGMINFNILHTPHRISGVDPGPSYGVNQVNELHVNQSYTIEADQRNNCRMILAGKTKTVVEPDTKKPKQIAVTVDETEQHDQKDGLYFYLSLVADKACPGLVQKFAEGTVWKATPGFVRRVDRPPPVVMDHFGGLRPMSSFDGGMRFMSESAFFPSHHWTEAYPYSVSAMSRLSGEVEHGYDDEDPSEDMADVYHSSPAASYSVAATPPPPPTTTTTASTPVFPSGLPTGSPPFPIAHSFLPAPAPLGLSRFPRGPSNSASVQHSPPPPRFHQRSFVSQTGSSPSGASAPFPSRFRSAHSLSAAAAPWAYGASLPNLTAESFDVGSTQAGELKYGNRVTVQSNYTGHDYDYEHCSEPTVLCMSIWQDMKFLPLSDIQEQLDCEIKDMIDNEGKMLIESLNGVFQAETCVIDMESEADTIICTCGHQCINHTNIDAKLRTCPLCRTPITAFVRSDGILLQQT